MEKAENWRDGHFSFFTNSACEAFPCHEGIDAEKFNCLFCYCPLYALGERCGGNYRYTQRGIKDCSACALPHIKENYGSIMEKLQEISALTAKNKHS